MAGFALIVRRDRLSAPTVRATLASLARHLSPDNIHANHPDVFEEEGLARVVINPVASVRVADHGVLLGVLFEDADWFALGAPPPDGAFAIVRHDKDQVELLTDAFASRTVWYVHSDDLFLAATSQRALVAIQGDYEPCPEAVTWMVASGNLGPEHGWDRRLRRVPAATRLRLDRRTWSLTSARSELRYVPRTLPEQDHLARIRESIFAACAQLRLDGAKTALTLSGGHDSRSLLVGLTHAHVPATCLTWGLRSSMADPRNDAFIARQLAERFGLRHEYLVLDPGDRPMRDCFSRFLRAGEGRVEDFGGYTDGFDGWRHIFEAGISVVLRGDSPGWGFPFEPFNDSWARSVVHRTTLVDDYPEGEIIHALDLAPQRPPSWIFMAEGETLDQYRDRIYNEFELPTCMAAFNDVKCAYAEVVNPLFARTVVTTASELPDELRHLRKGFERVVDGLVPDVPFAVRGADEPLDRSLARGPVQAELLRELASADARQVFSTSALDAVTADLERPLSETKRRLRARARAAVPRRLVSAVRAVGLAPYVHPHLHGDARTIAYRMYIASRMAAILREDCSAVSRWQR